MNGPYMLGIETSCDETACALVNRDGIVLINAVASQVELHARFGGVVPEEASRLHLEALLPMIETTLEGAQVGWDEIVGIAVTHAPGLIGCLLMGVETAKALAWSREKPLHAVHHLRAHLHAPFLVPATEPERPRPAHLLIEAGRDVPVLPTLPDPASLAIHPLPEGCVIARPGYPHVGLIISGGHTSLALVDSPNRFRTVATTRDDAVGEAYDKIARILDVGFPGGPVIDRLAAAGDPKRFYFTPPMKRRDERDFSFSGLKTAVARKIGELRESAQLDDEAVRDLCAGFQATAIDVLLSKALDAAREHGVEDLLIVGGVASNRGLRAAARKSAAGSLRIWFPHISLCTDNAAMIAGLGWHVPPLAPMAALDLNPVAVMGLD